MIQEERQKTLYKRMKEEQEQFREWLKTQPAQEILKHTYEYTIREDILMCMEELELSEEQVAVFLKSPFPLSEAYMEFTKWESGYMDDLRSAIKTCADHTLVSKNVRDSAADS